MIEHINLFVYSGTGNTWKVAQSICSVAEQLGVSGTIYPIDTKAKPEEHQPDVNYLLGLLSPTIGAIQPWCFFRFVSKLPKGSRQPVFLAATGAWTRIGKLFLPGYVGFGLYLAALMLLIKGYRVVGTEGFGMPHNWTTLIPPYGEKLERRINLELPEATTGFITKLLQGGRVFHRIGDLIFTLIIFPLPVLFLLFGHKFLAKTMFAGEACNGCGLCAKHCPNQAIRMLGKEQRPYWTFRCEQCMRCAGFCPQKAVDCNSLIVLSFIALFAAIPLETILTHVVFSLLPQLDGFRQTIVVYLLYYVIVLLLAAGIYLVFYLLSRIPVVNRLMTRLSFTHYWRKYRRTDVPIETLIKH